MDEADLGLEMQWQREEAVDKLIKEISIYDGDSSTIMTHTQFQIFMFNPKKQVATRMQDFNQNDLGKAYEHFTQYIKPGLLKKGPPNVTYLLTGV